MFGAAISDPYQIQKAFILKQIKKCLAAIQKNRKEITAADNQTEKDILRETNAVLKRKTDYLKKELENIKNIQEKSENKE